MEYLEEHDNLRRKTSIHDNQNNNISLSTKPGNNKFQKNVELTPIADRKNSEAMRNEVLNKMNVLKKKKPGCLLLGICGGQSSGKSVISSYLKKHLKHSKIICEKDFFIGNKDRRKSLAEEKLKNIDLNNENDEYPNTRKHRLVETNSIQCFDFETFKSNLESVQKGNVTKFQKWDKEKHIIIHDSIVIDPEINKVLIVEGQFLYYREELRNLFDYKIFVETDDDIRLARMVLKENEYLQDRPPAFKTFFTIYEDVIKPCYQKYIEASKKYAHIILPNFSFNSSLEVNETSVLDFMVLNLAGINNKSDL